MIPNVMIPKSMRTLPKDARGYPIPFIVAKDRRGVAQFAVNDHERVHTASIKQLCGICGKRLTHGGWFIGGPGSFLMEYGAFLDPHMHQECATYALKVCPYLAAPRYLKRVEGKRMEAGGVPKDYVVVVNEAAKEGRPLIFMLGQAMEWRGIVKPEEIVFHSQAWSYVEFWLDGVQVQAPARYWIQRQCGLEADCIR